AWQINFQIYRGTEAQDALPVEVDFTLKGIIEGCHNTNFRTALLSTHGHSAHFSVILRPFHGRNLHFLFIPRVDSDDAVESFNVDLRLVSHSKGFRFLFRLTFIFGFRSSLMRG